MSSSELNTIANPRRPTCPEMVGSAARSGWQGDADHRYSWSIWTAHHVCLGSGSCQNAGHGRTVVEVGRFVPFDRESWIDSVDRIGRIGAQHRIRRFCPVDCVGGIDIVRFLRGLGALLRFGALSSIALVVVEQRGRSRRTEGASPAHICRRQRGRARRALGSVQPQALEPDRRRGRGRRADRRGPRGASFAVITKPARDGVTSRWRPTLHGSLCQWRPGRGSGCGHRGRSHLAGLRLECLVTGWLRGEVAGWSGGRLCRGVRRCARPSARRSGDGRSASGSRGCPVVLSLPR